MGRSMGMPAAVAWVRAAWAAAAPAARPSVISYSALPFPTAPAPAPQRRSRLTPSSLPQCRRAVSRIAYPAPYECDDELAQTAVALRMGVGHEEGVHLVEPAGALGA